MDNQIMDNQIMDNQITEIISLTDTAINKVKGLIEEENNYNLKLRIFVQGGGCSGFQYGFTFEEAVAEDDFVIEKQSDGIKIAFLIDSMSSQYLQGATIDFVSNLEGEQFVIKNPNATTTCGCGSSFSA